MRASPYDLVDLGLEPVRVETAAGKAEYAEAQRLFAERAALRSRLAAECERLLATGDVRPWRGRREPPYRRCMNTPVHPIEAKVPHPGR